MDIAFTDIQGLQSIGALARTDRGAALGQVARQFESFFVAQMLKGMRAANEVFAEDDPMNTREMKFRTEMLDQQLSQSLTQGRSLGLAAVFERQLQRQYGAGDASAHADPTRLDPKQRELREVERAAPEPAQLQRAALRDRAPEPVLPPVVRNALRLLEPVVEQAREKLASVVRFTDKEGFVRALAAPAKEAAQRLGVDHRVLIAQAALETGWGQSILGDSSGNSSFNLFNIKAGSFWNGRSVGVTTLEFSNGIPRPERARFRAYGSFAESFSDYAEFLLSGTRYQRAIAGSASPERFIGGLQQAGYATDPEYAAKVLRLMRDPVIAGAP